MGLFLQGCRMPKSTLIDSNAEMPTRRKAGNGHRERLNEMTPRTGDVIVRSASNDTKMQKVAEMTTFNGYFNFLS
jgi:hypothetical protein